MEKLIFFHSSCGKNIVEKQKENKVFHNIHSIIINKINNKKEGIENEICN